MSFNHTDYKYKLYGAILGDLAGQPYEYKYKGDYGEFNLHDPKSHITDDTILTLATAAYTLGKFPCFESAYRTLGNRYINLDCFGKGFEKWLSTSYGTKNNSYGNGCLMRISPIMYINTPNSRIKELLLESCMNSHNHPKSFLAVLDLNTQYYFSTYQDVKFITYSKINRLHNFLKFDKFDVTAEGSIKFIKKAAFQTYSTQLAVENTVKCGGDTDTNASILGELMNYTFQDIRFEDAQYVESKLDSYLLQILLDFNEKF